MAKIEEQDISHIHAVRNKTKGRENKLLKSIPALVEANYIYLKIVLLKTKYKNCGNKGHKFSHWRKKPKSKIKKYKFGLLYKWTKSNRDN